MKIFQPDGTTLAVELGNTQPTGGYLVESFTTGGRTRRRITVSSPVVDYEWEITSALNTPTLQLVVFVEAPTTAALRSRVDALVAAVETPGFHVEDTVTGRRWVCWPADSSAPAPDPGSGHLWTEVTFTIPARQESS